jgi:hypothetical protein
MNAAVVDLFDGVDDLIRRVADTENPEIRKVRARVHAALVVAKSACEGEGMPAPTAAQIAVPAPAAPGIIEAEEDDIGQYSTESLGVALLFGLGLGLMLWQRSDSP